MQIDLTYPLMGDLPQDIVYLEGILCLLSWKNKKQSVVAQSSVEVEYRSMARATCEPVWIK